MRFGIIDNSTMKIEHDNKPPIIASIREFERTKFLSKDVNGDLVNPFNEINSFMESKLSRTNRDAIFTAYQKIFDEFALRCLDIDILLKCITENMKVIYDIVKVDDVCKYLEENNLFDIPPDIKDSYTGEYSEDRTYIRPKYKGLIALGISARMVIPIWGEFAPLRKNGVGPKRIPIMLMKMLNGTSILESQQFMDLEAYSNATVEAGKHELGLIANGFGTEFNLNINLAANFVKKVALAPNSKDNPLAQDIYNFIANRGAYNDSAPGDMIWPKKDMGQNEEERSKWERYNQREKMSQGDISLIEHYTDDVRRVATSILKDIPDFLLSDAERLVAHLDSVDFQPTDMNRVIVQWMFAYVLPPKTITYVESFYQRRILAAAVSILRQLGYLHLAALVISEEAISADGHVVSMRVARRQMPAELDEKLNALYPLRRTSRETRDKDAGNMAKNAINDYYTAVSNAVLAVVADKEFTNYLVKQGVLNRHLRHSVQPETPIELARLIIDINDIAENNGYLPSK